ncbi:MAG: hypothetical protein ACR2RE_19095 [Geminicoccaceae bacterium]
MSWETFKYEWFTGDFDSPRYHADHPDPYISGTAQDVLDFQDALASNPNASAPAGMPMDIEEEEREIARMNSNG